MTVTTSTPSPTTTVHYINLVATYGDFFSVNPAPPPPIWAKASDKSGSKHRKSNNDSNNKTNCSISRRCYGGGQKDSSSSPRPEEGLQNDSG